MRSLWIAATLLTAALADSTTTSSASSTSTSQSSTTSDTSSDSASLVTLSGTVDPFTIDQATGSVTYPSVTTTVTVSTSSGATTATGNSSYYSTTTSGSVTVLVGSQGVSTVLPNATATNANSTSTASSTPLPSNTQPCNGYVEFCDRSYSNITWVAAHNSPFDKKGNIASNQMYPVTTQLNDGIRMCTFVPLLIFFISSLPSEWYLTGVQCNSRHIMKTKPCTCAIPLAHC